jgi:hypothetical protein
MPMCAPKHLQRLAVGLLVALGGCAPRNGGVGTPLEGPRPVATYSCGIVLVLRVRLDATSAAVTAEGDGPYTLPLTSGRSDFTVYSDGTRVLQIYRGDVSFGPTPRVLFPCSASD